MIGFRSKLFFSALIASIASYMIGFRSKSLRVVVGTFKSWDNSLFCDVILLNWSLCGNIDITLVTAEVKRNIALTTSGNATTSTSTSAAPTAAPTTAKHLTNSVISGTSSNIPQDTAMSYTVFALLQIVLILISSDNIGLRFGISENIICLFTWVVRPVLRVYSSVIIYCDDINGRRFDGRDIYIFIILVGSDNLKITKK